MNPKPPPPGVTPRLDLDTPELAAVYDRECRRYQTPLGRRLLQRLLPGPGEHILDLGAGTGQLAAEVAIAVGQEGRVTALEPLPHRIALARRHHGHLRPLELRQEGAEALRHHPEGSYDAAYLNEVLPWIPAPEKALAELFRVLKPHGRLGLFGSRLELDNAFLGNPPFQQHLEGKLVDGSIYLRLETLLRSLGFRALDFSLFSATTLFPDPETVLDFFESSTFHNHLGLLPPVLGELARRQLLFNLEKKRTPEGIRIQSTCLQVLAVKPPPGPEALFRWWDLPLRRSLNGPAAIWRASFQRLSRKA